MTSDDRMTWGLIFNVLDMLERHGYHRYDSQHTSQAMGMIRDLAGVYEGTRDAPYGAGLHNAPPIPRAEPGPSGPEADDAVILTDADISTVIAALDDAAEYKRDRAETCADCADQSCTTCQWRLQAADTYDQMAGKMSHAAEASAARQRTPATRRLPPPAPMRPPTRRPDSDRAPDSPGPCRIGQTRQVTT